MDLCFLRAFSTILVGFCSKLEADGIRYFPKRSQLTNLPPRSQMVQISIAPRKDGHFWEVDDQIQRQSVVSGGLCDV